MKNIIRKSVFMVSMVVTLGVHAKEGLSLIDKDGQIKALLNIEYVKPGQLLSIVGNHGFVIYKEQIKTSGHYNKFFDLKRYPNGNYFFQIDKGLMIKKIPFKINYNVISFKKENERVIYKPNVRKKDNLLYVNRLSLKKAPLKIEIYYEVNYKQFELIYTETVKDTKILNKIYTLDSDKTGNYKVIFKTEDQVFIEKIIL